MSQKNPRPLTPQQRKAAEFIGKGRTLSDTAIYVKCRRETVSRWKHLPLFIAEVEKHRAELHERAMASLPQLADRTILALSKGLDGSDATRAALGLLKLLGPEKLLQLAAPNLTSE